MDPLWLDWAKRLQAIAQTGLTFASNGFDVERYQAVRTIAAEIMAKSSGVEVDRIVDLFARDQGYATPKVDVRGVVFRSDRVLLVKERQDQRWTLPGGWADVCESPSESVVREIYEESGFHARALKLLAVLDRSRHGHAPPHPHHIYKLFFLCALEGGTATAGAETSEVDFFPEDAIPELSLGRVTREQLARMFEHHRDSELPVDFD